MNHIGSHHLQASGGNDRLRIVALIEAAARHRHNAQLFVGEIDRILRQRPLGRRFWRLAVGLLGCRRRLGRARRQFRLALGELPSSAVVKPGLKGFDCQAG
jgi:hypothetical protein